MNRKKRKIGITRNSTGDFLFIFGEKNKWALPSGDLQRHCGPICAVFALGRQMAVPTFFPDCFFF